MTNKFMKDLLNFLNMQRSAEEGSFYDKYYLLLDDFRAFSFGVVNYGCNLFPIYLVDEHETGTPSRGEHITCIAYLMLSPGYPGKVEDIHVYTDEKYRKQGIASFLFEEVLRDLQRKKNDIRVTIQCDVRDFLCAVLTQGFSEVSTNTFLWTRPKGMLYA